MANSNSENIKSALTLEQMCIYTLQSSLLIAYDV